MEKINSEAAVLLIGVLAAAIAVANLALQGIKVFARYQLVSQLLLGVGSACFLWWLLSNQSDHLAIAQGLVHLASGFATGFLSVCQFLWHLIVHNKPTL
jgi:hypothetical protein